MPDIAKYSGITMADIAKISGQTVASGGGGGVSESSTGVLYFEAGGFNSAIPDAQEYFSASAVNLYKAQLSTRTDIVEMKNGQYHTFALDSSGNLYSSGYANFQYMGRAVSSDGHQFVQTLTSVSKFAAHDQGGWAIKTDGTLWWCGSIGSYANSGDTGQSTTLTSYSWKQFGTDTDWIDIDCFPTFPQMALAIKGGTGSEYVYSCGNNYFGKTGLGTISGNTKPWTRVKSDASTDWAETVDKISCGYTSSMFVTKSGKLFACGDAAQGHLGQGNTTDYLYPIQVGTDTDWSIPYAKGRFAGFAIKTNGTLYSSAFASYYYNIYPSVQDRTYRQIGTDTDYELILSSNERDSNERNYFLWAKKNGTWHANWANVLTAGSFIGNTSNKAAATDNTWYTVNDLLEGNDVTVSVNYVLMAFKEHSTGLGEVLTIATAAT